MKLLSYVLLLAVIVMSQGGKPYYNISDAPSLFEKFMRDYNRNYKDEADKSVHYQEFVKSLEIINKSNAESPSATFDINNFADYTPEERKHLLGRKVSALASSRKPHYELSDAPALFEKYMKDYRRLYKDLDDKKQHYDAFVRSLKIINESNAASETATFDINNLSDYTEEEKKHLFGVIKKGSSERAVGAT